MSSALEKRLPIGPVQVYWNDVRMGSPRSQATVRHTKETVQARFQETGVNVLSHKVGEVAEVDVVIADFNLAKMRYVYDHAAGFDAVGTIKTTPYTSTATVTTFRFREEHKLSGTAAVTLDRSGFVAGSVKVYKSDFSKEYVSSTDYTATAGTVARLAGGDIDDLETVYIEYNQSATAERLGAGGGLEDFEAPLKLVYEQSDGKALMFYAYRAKKIGASDIAIQMAAEYEGEPMTFHILADATQRPGEQLFYWAEET